MQAFSSNSQDPSALIQGPEASKAFPAAGGLGANLGEILQTIVIVSIESEWGCCQARFQVQGAGPRFQLEVGQKQPQRNNTGTTLSVRRGIW